MENIRLQKLHPVIRSQEQRMEAMRQIIRSEKAKNESKMAQYAQNAQDKAAHNRSLKHDFTIDAYLEPAPDSAFTDVVASLRDDRTGWVLLRVPTQATMENGRKARRENVQRIIDLLV
ncbi:MAG: hypothetical protein GX262_01830 [Clostridia bacterium]|nr:hypothetical protein [Clostridia bacterium]